MTPEQEEQVRRALTGLRDGEPADHGSGGAASMPPEVAARLDGVLADLVRQRAHDPPPSSGPDRADELARRRRGRWQKGGLAAAAACVAALVGTAVANGGLGAGEVSSTSGTDSARSADSGTDGSLERAPAAGRPEAPGRSPGPPPGTTASRQVGVAPLARLRTPTLASDVQRLLDSDVRARADPRPAGPVDASTCTAPVLRQGERLVPVRLDGRRASLVLGPADAGRRPARVVECRDPENTLATVVVRSRAR